MSESELVDLGLPTIEEEVTRKALAEVRRLLEDYSFKRISKRELELCLATVWNCVSGCTREAFHEITTAASIHLRKLSEDAPMFEVLVKGDAMVLTHSRPGCPTAFVFHIYKGKLAVKTYNCDQEERPEQMAFQKRLHLSKQLQASGFEHVGAIL